MTNQIQVNVSQAPQAVETVDILAQSMCKANDGETYNRLFNGLFTLPYEPVTDIFVADKKYYFDVVNFDDEEKPIFQYYSWRCWGYKALDLIECLTEKKLQLTEIK
jgi:hypothetical protein